MRTMFHFLAARRKFAYLRWVLPNLASGKPAVRGQGAHESPYHLVTHPTRVLAANTLSPARACRIIFLPLWPALLSATSRPCRVGRKRCRAVPALRELAAGARDAWLSLGSDLGSPAARGTPLRRTSAVSPGSRPASCG